ncbi:MAG: hypothetical protein ACI9IP_003432, partial [Arcticibacterium sp.]
KAVFVSRFSNSKICEGRGCQSPFSTSGRVISING